MGSKHRSVLTLDLAGVCVAEEDIDEGCRLAGQAAMTLHEVGYATAVAWLVSLWDSDRSDDVGRVRIDETTEYGTAQGRKGGGPWDVALSRRKAASARARRRHLDRG